MKRLMALLVTLAFAAGMLGSPAVWAQTKAAPAKEAPAKSETKAPAKKGLVDLNSASADELLHILARLFLNHIHHIVAGDDAQQTVAVIDDRHRQVIAFAKKIGHLLLVHRCRDAGDIRLHDLR